MSSCKDRCFFLSLGAFACVVILFCAGAALLYSTHLTRRYVPGEHLVQSETLIWTQTSSAPQAAEIMDMMREDTDLQAALAEPGGMTGGKHLALMRWIMNRFPQIGPTEENSPYALLKSREGVTCWHMAAAFAEAATLLGSKARMLGFSAGFGDIWDSHVAVELWQDDRWILYDPTFNLTFRDADGNLLDAVSLRALTRVAAPVRYEFHGEVAYPARLETYYIQYPQLLQVITVDVPAEFSLAKFPPLRYFYGSKRYVLSNMDRLRNIFFFHEAIYASVTVALPLLGLLLFLCCLALRPRRVAG